MADKKISQLTAATTPLAGTEVLPIVQGGSTVKVAVSDLTAGRDVSAKDLTTTGNTILGDASTDTLNVGNGDIIKDASGNVGFNVTPKVWGGIKTVQVGSGANFFSTNAAASGWTTNLYYNGSAYKYLITGVPARIAIASGTLTYQNAVSGSADADATLISRFQVTAAGDVNVMTGNLVIGTSGKGIDFSATSEGSGTMTSELLADYEEGSWTPVLSDGTNNATMHSSTEGTYTKIGNVVFYRARCRTSSLGSVSGNIRITGLPYAVTNNNSNSGGGCTAGYGYLFAITAGYSVSQLPVPSTSYIGVYVWDNAAGATPMVATEWSNTGDLQFGGHYYV